MRFYAVKVDGAGLIPATEDDNEIFDKLKNRTTYRVDAVKERNSLFHRKVLSLIRLGFKTWEPKIEEIEFKGRKFIPEKNFEKFREDVIKAAGFFEVVWNLDGTFETRAKSISFDKMDETQFEEVFSAIIDVLLRDVLATYTRKDIDEVVDKIIGYV